MSEPSQAQQAYYQFCSLYVHSVIEWNAAEEVAFDLLEALSPPGLGPTLAIRQLKSVPLKDTLALMAKALRISENQVGAEHLEHFVEGFDRLRAYRNFYVHCIRAVAQTNETSAELHSLEVKGNLSLVTHRLTNTELSAFCRSTMQLAHYGRSIEPFISADSPSLPASPQKPTWPDKLKKTRDNLLTR